MKILITGGAGFIGSNLVEALHREGYEITVIDNLSEQVHGVYSEAASSFGKICDRVRFICGSVCDRETMEHALAGQQVVVHYAAETGTGQSMYMVDHYTRVNIQATSMMLDILSARKDHGIKRIVVASSRSIYGEGKYLDSKGTPIYPSHRNQRHMQAGQFEVCDLQTDAPLTLVATDEDSLIHPSSVYGITKQVQEQLVMTVCPLLGIEPVALRYQNVYGPGQSLSNPYTGILSIFSNQILGGGKINVFEDGLESRDFIYIDDVVSATLLAVVHANAASQVFNVGSGVATTVLEVVKHLKAAFDSDIEVNVSGDFRIGDIRHNYADLKKINSLLGFAPKVDFADGIQRFASWAGAQGPKASSYERSLSEMKERGLIRGVDC
jgi:dTDP-L-rhamnose 4-epimerase